jgi:NAD-dependent deacetylase
MRCWPTGATSSHFTLITQNVDGLHEPAGTLGLLRFHGSIWELRCVNRCAASPARWPVETTPLPTRLLRCPACGGLARPGVVWFAEAIEPDILDRNLAATDYDLFPTVGMVAGHSPPARR